MTIQLLKEDGITVALSPGVPVSVAITATRERVGTMVVQIPPIDEATGRRIAISWGSPAPAPTFTTPGSQRIIGPGVWSLGVYGTDVKFDVDAGPDFSIEVSFGTQLRTNKEALSRNTTS